MQGVCASLDVSDAVHRGKRLSVSDASAVQHCSVLLQSGQSRRFGVFAECLLPLQYTMLQWEYTKKSIITRMLRIMITIPIIVRVELYHVVNMIPSGTKYYSPLV